MSRLSLKGQALKFLAMREHSRLELRRKLLPHARRALALDTEPADSAVVAETLDALLDWLQANDLLSQQRFVESRVRTRSSRFGVSRIKQELAQHGVGLTPDLRSDLERSEFERARHVWSQRFEPALDAAAKAKQIRFLSARGFSPDVVRLVVSQRRPRDGGVDGSSDGGSDGTGDD